MTETVTPAEAPTATPEPKASSWKSLLTFLVAAWVLRCLIVAPFSIPSGSMLPGLYIGDYLLVAKWPYGYSKNSFLFGIPPIPGRLFSHLPERGDVVVFIGPEGEDVIKRVVGLPGDTIATRDGQLILNDRPVARQAIPDVQLPVSPNTPCRQITPAGVSMSVPAGQPCAFHAYRETLPNGRSYVTLDQIDNPLADDFGPVRVPAGTVFMMGDNRDDSADSRFAPEMGGMGFVPVENLVGRALISFWSTDGSASWINPISWFTALRPSRMGHVYR
ncbi:signal peptidase I [Sphingomonas ginkgonis]|uniref:signal peptidase I n=1 Tax=Sphingomonas ginkgonis TaxID=2315330 RepID=UPI001EF0CB7C|nr:signal peptidase I [Sphingomonas ginkgonis]